MDDFYTDIRTIVQGYSHPPIRDIRSGTERTYSYGNIMLLPPKITPQECRLRNMSYFADLLVEIIEHESGPQGSTVTVHPMIKMAEIPVMLRSQLCKLYGLTEKQTIDIGECIYNKGGYFIYKGKEKVIISQERAGYNQIVVHPPVKGPEKKGYSLMAETRTVTVRGSKPSIVKVILSNDHKRIDVLMPGLATPVNLMYILSYLGCKTAEEAQRLICGKLVERDVKEDEVKDTPDDTDLVKRKVFRLSDQKKEKFHDQLEFILYHGEKYLQSSTEACILAISHGFSDAIDKKQAAEAVHHLLYDEIFPNAVSDPKYKISYLCTMVYMLLLTSTGCRQPDGRDNFVVKRVDMPGKLLEDLFRGFFNIYNQNVLSKLSSQPGNISIFEREPCITTGIQQCINTGNWGVLKNGFRKIGVCQSITNISYLSVLSHVRRTCSNRATEGRATGMRQLHNSQWGIFDPAETPEGEMSGIIKNHTIGFHVTSHVDTQNVCQMIREMDDVDTSFRDHSGVRIMVDGVLVGLTMKPERVSKDLRHLRNTGVINRSISITYRISDDMIVVCGEASRTCRPLMVVGSRPVTQEMKTWNDLIQAGCIRYVDTSEEEWSVVSPLPEQIRKGSDYAEIHPSMIIGIVTGIIPFCNHCPGPRNSYAGNMAKQAIGAYALNYLQRYDTSLYIHQQPEVPLVQTDISHYIDYNELPCGQNAIVAVMPRGDNQEDSVMINKMSVDVGMFSIAVHKSYTVEEKCQGNQSTLTIEIPPPKCRKAIYNYLKLDKDGIIKKGARVGKFDVIVAMTARRDGKAGEPADSSLYYKLDEEGVVENILVTRNGEGNKLVRVKIVQYRPVRPGDKFANRNAQKGTTGCLVRKEDMPFSADGLSPDIFINTAAFPSRMTIHQFLEMMLANYAVLKGEFQDGSSFQNVVDKMEAVAEGLKSLGFNSRGEERLYDGETGEMFRATIFVGPVYYQRLKHLIMDKLSARSDGPVNNLLQQPANQGRKNGTELTANRVGTMEADTFLSHGGPMSLYERLMVCSDKYAVNVCDNCGNIPNSKACCGHVSTVHIPYVAKLIRQNVAGMMIGMNIKPSRS
jgi:DNA-directed RNA polymerase II subunit RPB2